MDPRTDPGRDLFELLAPGSGKRNRRALAVQRFRDRLADAARSAGDKRAFPGQIKHAVRSSSAVTLPAPSATRQRP